jgi:hypothetical protein
MPILLLVVKHLKTLIISLEQQQFNLQNNYSGKKLLSCISTQTRINYNAR